MKKPLMIAAMLLMAFSTAVFADIAPPTTPKPKPTPKTKEIDSYLEIKLNENFKEAKLLIPRSQLKQLRAELEQLENGEDTNAAVTDSGTGFRNAQNVFAGGFMSLAFLFGGVWLFRSKAAKNVKVAGALVLISLSGAAATYVYANAGPPPEARTITSKSFSKGFSYYNFGGGKIKLGMTNEENPILQVPLVKETPTPSE